jgi:hypothetical protein
VPDKKVGSCLDPELPRTGLRGVGLDAGSGQTSLKEKSQLEPSRDGGDVQDVMQEDQQPTE